MHATKFTKNDPLSSYAEHQQLINDPTVIQKEIVLSINELLKINDLPSYLLKGSTLFIN